MAKIKNNKLSILSSKRNISILLIVIIASFGAWRVFLSGASPNNCQPEKGVNICDIDQVQGNVDNILSNGPEAYNLNKNDPGNWPLYFGTAFRAPTNALDGAQPVYRVYNSSASWHDYMLEAGKKDKEAKAAGKVANEGIVFYAWPDGSRPGTVPVYRLTQVGGTTKVIFTTDRAWRDKAVAADINNADGWKDGGIPFYAFPPAYKAIATDGKPQVNPYDCSVKENFVSERCTAQRNNLANAIATGVIAASNDCPATLEAYIKEPFPSRFPQECQDKWNKELSNCSVKENFVSDRCKDARAAFDKAEEERIARENAERQAAASRQSRNTGSVSRAGGGDNGDDGVTPGDTSTNCPDGEIFLYGKCINAAALDSLARAQKCQNEGNTWYAAGNGTCVGAGSTIGRNWKCQLIPGQMNTAAQGKPPKWKKGIAQTWEFKNVLAKALAENNCKGKASSLNREERFKEYKYRLDGPY